MANSQAFATVAKVDALKGDCAERQHDQGGVSGAPPRAQTHGLPPPRARFPAPTTRPAASRSRMPRRRPAAPAPRRFGRHRPSIVYATLRCPRRLTADATTAPNIATITGWHR